MSYDIKWVAGNNVFKIDDREDFGEAMDVAKFYAKSYCFRGQIPDSKVERLEEEGRHIGFIVEEEGRRPVSWVVR